MMFVLWELGFSVLQHMKSELLNTEQNFTTFVKDIKAKILQSQCQVLKSVNKELINIYWDIGKNIVEKQKQFGWTKNVSINQIENIFDI